MKMHVSKYIEIIYKKLKWIITVNPELKEYNEMVLTVFLVCWYQEYNLDLHSVVEFDVSLHMT